MGPVCTRRGDHNDSVKIVLIGLDASGKTTLLYKLKLNEVVDPLPTIGFNIETLKPIEGLTMTMSDVGGQDKMRALWKHYVHNTHGILWVVDSADRERFQESLEALKSILKQPEMPASVPVVIFANKQNLPGAASTSEVEAKLNMKNLTDRKWHIHGTCATTGDGIYEGMHERARLVKDYKKSSRGI